MSTIGQLLKRVYDTEELLFLKSESHKNTK